jgi:hypothetical protein
VQGDQLLVKVNGYPLSKNSSRTISYDSVKNKWFPCAKLEEKGNTIIYTPLTFSTNSTIQTEYQLVFGKHELDAEPEEL